MPERSGAPEAPIPSLLPSGAGHQFVAYGDSCSGVPGAPHERNLAEINRVLRRLAPAPEFVLFTGDEIAGLTPDESTLRRQWAHFLGREMAGLHGAFPVWHCTGNHTTYDRMSEGVFRDVLRMPGNGPPGQEGLAYYVRRGDLLVVFVHTLATGLGGESHVETAWLRLVLREHRDARHKLVVGHHPAFPVNGYAGPYQRTIGPEHAGLFWDALVEAGVAAYICSHILAFDVQAHRGVLQLCTAGAGTAHRMPEETEYLHLVQAALDAGGLRCQVLDIAGRVRERLRWPLPDLRANAWREIPGESPAPLTGPAAGRVVRLRFRGTASVQSGAAQTLLCATHPGVQPPFSIGLRGSPPRLVATIAPEPGRSPHYWLGQGAPPGAPFDLELAIHPGMGPGGLLLRGAGSDAPWSSMEAASPWGAERLRWPPAWIVGHGPEGDEAFGGTGLSLYAAVDDGED